MTLQRKKSDDNWFDLVCRYPRTTGQHAGRV